jgi:hypothetical protein
VPAPDMALNDEVVPKHVDAADEAVKVIHAYQVPVGRVGGCQSLEWMINNGRLIVFSICRTNSLSQGKCIINTIRKPAEYPTRPARGNKILVRILALLSGPAGYPGSPRTSEVRVRNSS